MRPRVSVYIATSLDGFIARTDGGLDWLDTVQLEGEDYGYAAFVATVNTMVVWRATWEVARGFDPWPWAGKRVLVLTHRPIDARHGEETHAGRSRRSWTPSARATSTSTEVSPSPGRWPRRWWTT